MALPNALDIKIRQRFDELIEEAESLLSTLDEFNRNQYVIYREWQVKASGLLVMVYGESEEVGKYLSTIEKYPGQTAGTTGSPWKKIYASRVETSIAILKGIRDNYVNGFLISIEEQIIANVSADYMEQAKALLDEGIPGQYDHVPAAVLCGAVLEDALRRLCLRQTPTIKITKSNGQKKTMEPLIQDLQKSQVINKLEADQLRGWAKIRNYSAHSEFCNFERADVDGMLLGVKHFLAKHL